MIALGVPDLSLNDADCNWKFVNMYLKQQKIISNISNSCTDCQFIGRMCKPFTNYFNLISASSVLLSMDMIAIDPPPTS